MKKKVIIIFGAFLTLIIAWMGYNSLRKLEKKEAIRNTQNDLAKILNKLSQTDIDLATPTIIIFSIVNVKTVD